MASGGSNVGKSESGKNMNGLVEMMSDIKGYLFKLIECFCAISKPEKAAFLLETK
jgi:hypothetical protein